MTEGDWPTHLDRVMLEHGIANHQLARQVGVSRQTIYKLRTGRSRMLPHWAKRLAPHLGVTWEELIEGTPAKIDSVRAELLKIFDSMTDAERETLLRLAYSLRPFQPAERRSSESACVVPLPSRRRHRQT